MIDRYLLRYFLAVVDRGNFSKAAAACNVSQPTLSVGIAKLERLLGRPLFNRSNRRVELTEAGVRLRDHARIIEACFAAAERTVSEASAARTLRLGILPTIATATIEQFLRRLAQSGSDDRVEIVEARDRDLVERLGSGRIDVALTLIRPGERRFEAHPLYVEEYSLAMAAGHPLAAKPLIQAEELANAPMIVRAHCEILPETSRFFTARGIRPHFPARVTSDDRALAYVRAGLGVTVMPGNHVAEGVVRPRLADFDMAREIGLVFAHHVDPGQLRDEPVLRTLIDAVMATR